MSEYPDLGWRRYALAIIFGVFALVVALVFLAALLFLGTRAT